MPRLLLLRRRPSYGVWNTEENCTSKRHTKREANPSLSELISWPLFFLHQFIVFVHLLMFRNFGELDNPHDHLFFLLKIIFDRKFRKVVLLVLQQCGEDCVIVGGRSKSFVDKWP